MDYDKLKRDITYLKAKCAVVEYQIAETYRLAGLSWLESERNPQLDDVSPMFMSAVMILVNQKVDLEAEIARLDAQLPCDEFIRRFGLSLHDLYREKYSINKNTVICKVYTAFPVWRYALPIGIDIGDAPDLLNAPRSIVKIDYGEARFETWGHTNAPWYDLAYAPEINTVFVR